MSDFPTIVPASVIGKNAPGNQIQIGIIGCGRYAISHDIPLTALYQNSRIIAVCDVDAVRTAAAIPIIQSSYRQAANSRNENISDWSIKVYDNYRELLLNPEIDAVIISLPDHQHAVVAVHAVRAGKHVYLQKPATLTIEEGKILREEVHRSGKVLQIGSQQRSLFPWPQFKRAAELVRNGKIGELNEVKIGFPADTGGGHSLVLPIPADLNYDAWLGPTSFLEYMEDRVHPRSGHQNGIYQRPGWLRCESFATGMITNWGSHHIDIAHWAMDTEQSGPKEIIGKAKFPREDENYSGLWDVHGHFETEALYDNGVKMYISSKLPHGIQFVGSEGWIWVTRGNCCWKDGIPIPDEQGIIALNASNHKILLPEMKTGKTLLYESQEQHLNWLNCILSGTTPAAPIEIGHRSNSACLLHWIAMKVNRKIHWDPIKEEFSIYDPEATALLSRTRRKEYDF
ncbi:MAG: Gfo/Idh/MocA family oxidoreductase [Chitinophagaceae bacterium]|nr:Gfo/Idh/MocA family oxidoreductase [Chitinophagaceae bacterium]